MALIKEGNIIAGKYRLERPLARGGMGSVWVAKHQQLDMLVAIKFMDVAAAASDEGRTRFEREAKAAAQIQSPHVVHIHDYGLEESKPYIVMELLKGEDLRTRLRRDRRLPIEDVSRIITQVAKALRKAHDAGLIHRDLKPANIFLSRGAEDDDEIVKVLDFGVVKVAGVDVATEATRTGVVIGSVHYMSPEQARGARDIDFRSDVWSLGVLAFRAIVGRHPFPGEQVGDVIVKICAEPIPKPSDIAPDLGPDVDRFFARALSRGVGERFQSARDLANELAVLAGTGSLVGATGAWPLAPAARQSMPSLGLPFSAPPSSKPAPPMIREAGGVPPSNLSPGSPISGRSSELPTKDALPLPAAAAEPASQPSIGGGTLTEASRVSDVSFAPAGAFRSRRRLIAAGIAALTALIGGWILLGSDQDPVSAPGAAPTVAITAAITEASSSGRAPADPPSSTTASAAAPSASATASARPARTSTVAPPPVRSAPTKGPPPKKVNSTLGI